MRAIEVNKNCWETNLPDEIYYWEQVISGKIENKEAISAFSQRVRGEIDFPRHLLDLLPSDGPARVLDVGAGPHTTLGSRNVTGNISLEAVDPLARQYNKLMKKYGVTPCIRSQEGSAEILVEIFGRNCFDIVYSRNAMDHSYDPFTGIINMVAVCKRGGHIFIEGSINEGVKQSYKGLHQWNFLTADDNCVIWNKLGARMLSNFIKDATIIYAKNINGRWYHILMRKNSV